MSSIYGKLYHKIDQLNFEKNCLSNQQWLTEYPMH